MIALQTTQTLLPKANSESSWDHQLKNQVEDVNS